MGTGITKQMQAFIKLKTQAPSFYNITQSVCEQPWDCSPPSAMPPSSDPASGTRPGWGCTTLSPYENSSSIVAQGQARRGFGGKEHLGIYYEKSSGIRKYGRSHPWQRANASKPTSAITRAMSATKAEAALFIAKAASYRPESL